MAHRNRLVLVVSVLVVALALIGYVLVSGYGEQEQTSEEKTASIKMPPPPTIESAGIVTLLAPDSIRSIDEPRFETAESADDNLDDEERVIGIVINGEARAYPIPILSSHEIVNDVVGGEPMAITWCPLCYTALVFSRRVEGQSQVLTFGVSGKLLYNTLVMFDRETNTLWSQLYGAAVDGSLDGTSLAVFPSLHTEWKVWRSQHPDTLVLSKRLTCEQFNCGTYSDNPRGSYEVDPYASYYNTPLEGVIDFQIPRETSRTLVKNRVLGVRIAGKARAYPYDLLANERLINDEMGGEPILVWFDPDTQTGVAYIRQIDNRVLTFFVDPEEPGSGYLFDEETGSRWNAATGKATTGALRGEKLPGIIVTPAFDFGWFDYFPDSERYTITP